MTRVRDVWRGRTLPRQSFLVRTETSTELSSALLELEYGLTGAWGDCLNTETPRVSTISLRILALTCSRADAR